MSHQTIQLRDGKLHVEWLKEEQNQPKGNTVEEQETPRTDVLICGFPSNTSKDFIELYFENKTRSGGGPIKSVTFDDPRTTAIVVFENPKGKLSPKK